MTPNRTVPRLGRTLAALLALVAMAAPASGQEYPGPSPQYWPVGGEFENGRAPDFFWIERPAPRIGATTFDGNRSTWSFRVDANKVRAPVYAPPGSLVSLSIRTLSGDPAQVVSLRDGAGEPLVFEVQRASARRVVLAPIPAGPDGGLEVVVEGLNGGSGTYQLVATSARDPAGFSEPERLDSWAPGQVVLCAEAGTDFAFLERLLGVDVRDEEYGAALVDLGVGGIEAARFMAMLLAGVGCAEPNALAEFPEGSLSSRLFLGSQFGREEYLDQRGLRSVRARQAHRRENGAGVVVAVLDTGIDPVHPVFADRLVPGFDLVDLVDQDGGPWERRDGLNQDGQGAPDDGFGHGTAVAGLVLAAAPEALIMPVRVLDTEGRGTAAEVAIEIRRAVDAGAHVINLSLGTDTFSVVLSDAVAYAHDHGVVVVAAAGNDGDKNGVEYPASERGVVAVTALGAAGRRTRFANGNRRTTTVAAPGTALVTTYPGGRWAKATGTSFATALASGGAALAIGAGRRSTAPAVVRHMTRRWKLDLLRLAR
jgi:subtilase family protein